MTPKLSDLDIPEIKAAAADWALVSTQIDKITLHRFKPSKLQGSKGPFYAIIIWVPPEIDVDRAPWMELLEGDEGEKILPEEKLREHYVAEDGKLDREQAREHPLYDLWNLFWELSAEESKEREGFCSFYRDGFERTDPRFDWLVMLLNVGDESLFAPGKMYDDMDNTDLGSILLFSRNSPDPQEDGETTQQPVSVESCSPEMNDDHGSIVALNIEPIKVTEAPHDVQELPERAPAESTTPENTPLQGHDNKILFNEQVWEDALRMYQILLQTGFEGRDADKKLQSAAKKDLTRNRKLYKFIKQKHLEKIALFALNPGQERRDFVGKLLQMITGGTRGRKPIGAQRLYEFGKKNYQNHN